MLIFWSKSWPDLYAKKMDYIKRITLYLMATLQTLVHIRVYNTKWKFEKILIL